MDGSVRLVWELQEHRLWWQLVLVEWRAAWVCCAGVVSKLCLCEVVHCGGWLVCWEQWRSCRRRSQAAESVHAIWTCGNRPRQRMAWWPMSGWLCEWTCQSGHRSVCIRWPNLCWIHVAPTIEMPKVLRRANWVHVPVGSWGLCKKVDPVGVWLRGIAGRCDIWIGVASKSIWVGHLQEFEETLGAKLPRTVFHLSIWDKAFGWWCGDTLVGLLPEEWSKCRVLPRIQGESPQHVVSRAIGCLGWAPSVFERARVVQSQGGSSQWYAHEMLHCEEKLWALCSTKMATC